MFDKRNTRKNVAIVWMIALLFFILLHILLIQPIRKQGLDEIQQIKQSVLNSDWSNAKKNQADLETLMKSNKFIILINNLSPAVSRFEQKLADIKELINQEDDDALEYIGSLENTYKSITSTFPTPEG